MGWAVGTLQKMVNSVQDIITVEYLREMPKGKDK